MSAAARQRRYRARQREGRRCLLIEVDEVALTEALAATHPPLLQPQEVDDPDKLAEAVERVIKRLIGAGDA